MLAQLHIDPAAALRRIAPFIRRTPMLKTPVDVVGADVHLKLESLQVTGSFKIRGAANAMLAMRDSESRKGRGPSKTELVTCSSGNHGRAVAHMAGVLGMPATICVPDWIDALKLEEMRRTGARVLLSGSTYDEAEARAAEIGRAGARMIHPFDAPRVIEGQATVALEILEQFAAVRTVLIPLSGGGLAGGMAEVLTAANVEVVAVSAEAANVMAQSLVAGRPVDAAEEKTLATALSGGIGLDNRWSFDLVRTRISRHVSVAEDRIREAVRWAFRRGLVVEGGGAVALAAVLAGIVDSDPDSTAVVISGGNIEPRLLERVLDG